MLLLFSWKDQKDQEIPINWRSGLLIFPLARLKNQINITGKILLLSNLEDSAVLRVAKREPPALAQNDAVKLQKRQRKQGIVKKYKKIGESGIMGDEEFPPLLPDGLVEMTVMELRALVVDKFPRSQTRRGLWDVFVLMLDEIAAANLSCKIWVDGSFLTEKIDPKDVDFVVDLPVEVLKKASQDQINLIENIARDPIQQPRHLGLHSFVMFTAPKGDDFYIASQESHAQWTRDFGQSYITKEPKGIAVIEVSS